MRRILFFIVMLTAYALSAQIKGVEPLDEKPADAPSGVIWAVVAGISDYECPEITDLRYAHRDANAFAEFLRSPAGGAVPTSHLTLLLNKDATAPNLAAALDALIEQVKENDQVIIYFSGHGDVERVKISQPGFLLCWNSPAHVYTGGGTYAITNLQEIVSTLSVLNKAKVLVITDACHSGKLAGNTIGGSAITGANLARQVANETKIMSCEADELSLEGLQWGGGRGVFSYHLVDGLYGLADTNGDGFVTVSEIDRYLEDHVSSEAAPQNQTPKVLGKKTEHLSKVDAELLAQIKQKKAAEPSALAAVETRGLEDQLLSKVDSSLRLMYLAFTENLKNGQFFEPAENCAETWYARLQAAPELGDLHGYMRRNYAAALQNEAQVAINDYLSADPQELRKRWSFDRRYDHFPRYLARAAELLGPQHYLYANLKAREYYFSGLNLRLRGEKTRDSTLYLSAIELQKQTLQLDSNAAYAYNELGLLCRRLNRYAKAAWYFEQAADISPSWVFPWANLCAVYTDMDQYEKAIEVGEKALALDSTFALSQYNLGYACHLLKDYTCAKMHYAATIKYDPNYHLAYFNLGLIHYWEKDPAAAEQIWLQYARLMPGDADVYLNLMYAKIEQQQSDAALDYLEKAFKTGFKDLDSLKDDPQLKDLRALPRYERLLLQYFPGKKP